MRPIDADHIKKRLPTFAEVIDEEPTLDIKKLNIVPKTRIVSRTAGLNTLPVCLRCHRGPLLDTYNFCPYCGLEIEGGGKR